MKTAINALIFDRNGQLLLVKKREIWILPGGKPEDSESDIMCLKRELKEELPKLIMPEQEIIFFGAFTGLTPHKGYQLTARAYFIRVTGSVSPAAEISEARFTKNPEELPLSEITKKIVLALRQKNYL